MKGHGAKFGRKKEEGNCSASFAQEAWKRPARAVDLNPNTLLRWLQLPEFGKEYRKARREAVHQSVARMQQGYRCAAGTVVLNS